MICRLEERGLLNQIPFARITDEARQTENPFGLALMERKITDEMQLEEVGLLESNPAC